MSKLRWSVRARSDLRSIGEYIAADDPVAAAAWVSALIARAAKAAAVPGVGRRVPELGLRDDLREVFLRRYRIVYQVFKHEIMIVTVFEASMTFPANLEIDER